MASQKTHINWLEITLILILHCFALVSSTSSERRGIKQDADHAYEEVKRMKLVLGSRPPRCVNRCKSCRPCMAVLVVPPHKPSTSSKATNFHNYYRPHNSEKKDTDKKMRLSAPQEDESYYLLAWKCRCKNKLFQP